MSKEELFFVSNFLKKTPVKSLTPNSLDKLMPILQGAEQKRKPTIPISTIVGGLKGRF